MLKKILTGAVALSVLAGASAAAAQPYRGHDHRYDRHEQRYDRYDRGDRYHRGDNRRHNRFEQRRWRRGERLPAAYRGRAYWVDYRSHRLPPPPYGYRYSRVGNDVVLTAIATGIIASVIIGAMN